MADLGPVYEELERLLERHSSRLRSTRDLADANTPASKARSKGDDRRQPSGRELALLGASTDRYPGGQLFGAVKQQKRYVSYYLIGVYMDPELLGGMSEALQARMQGKSCFNFTKVDANLFAELDALTSRCHALYDQANLLL